MATDPRNEYPYAETPRYTDPVDPLAPQMPLDDPDRVIRNPVVRDQNVTVVEAEKSGHGGVIIGIVLAIALAIGLVFVGTGADDVKDTSAGSMMNSTRDAASNAVDAAKGAATSAADATKDAAAEVPQALKDATTSGDQSTTRPNQDGSKGNLDQK